MSQNNKKFIYKTIKKVDSLNQQIKLQDKHIKMLKNKRADFTQKRFVKISKKPIKERLEPKKPELNTIRETPEAPIPAPRTKRPVPAPKIKKPVSAPQE